jgi:serine/threonine-protein kinase
MSPETHQRVRKLFDEAVELSGEERARLLEAERRRDPEVGEALERLLQAHRDSSGFLSDERPPRRLGRFIITREIGRGGMGIVYAAVDPVIGRSVAVKVIRIEPLADSAGAGFPIDQLINEARSSGTLLHPGIVLIFDVGQDEHLAFIAMELVEGQSLAEMLASGVVLEAQEILDALRQAAAALDYAHQKGVVHRDIKPANIMVTARQQIKIADFGVAKITTSLQETASGVAFGTPTYMSPEQIEMRNLDGRSDQFSMAVVAYELLTGSRPFQAESLAALAHQIVNLECPSARAVKPALPEAADRVLQRALAKSPEDRYRTCAEFVTDLERALAPLTAGRALNASPASPVPAAVDGNGPVKRFSFSAKTIRYGGAATLALLLAAFGVSRFALPVSTGRQPPVPRIDAPAAVPKILRFRASAEAIQPGAATELEWEVQQADEILIDHGIGKMPAIDSMTVAPLEKTTYVLTAKARGGEVSATVTIDVPAAASPRSAGRAKQLYIEAQAQRRALKLKSLALLRQAAELGYTPAMVALGEDALEGEDAGDKEAALQWFRRAAAGGNAVGMLNVGGMYHIGNGVPQDLDLAIYWYRQAAEAGNPSAMYNLGAMYENGRGVTADPVKAKEFYRKAAARGNTLAKRRLVQLGISVR